MANPTGKNSYLREVILELSRDVFSSEWGLATGTAYFIPARVGVWLVWCGSWGPVGDSGLSPPLAMGGRCFSKYVSGDGAYTDVFS